MVINDFAALLQLIATLSLAFVAVEYVRSFTEALCRRFFKFDRFLVKTLGACRASLFDKDTLASLQPVNVGDNHSTSNMIEKARREYESILKEIDNKEKEMNAKMTTACQARSMSSICLFISFSSFALLFTGAIEKMFTGLSHCFCSVFCLLSIIYLLAGWIYGEHEHPRRYCNFASFRNATLGALILAAISVVFAALLLFIPKLSTIGNAISENIWWWFLLAYTVFSFVNYFIFFRKIGRSTNVLKQEVCGFVSDIDPKCKKSNAEISRLLATQEVCIEVMSDIEISDSDKSKGSTD